MATRLKPLASCYITVRHSSTAASAIKFHSIPAPHSGSICILSLNNPKSRNAISRALLAELTSHIESIHAEGPQGPTRAVILASDIDASFCAGADLKERKTFTAEEYTLWSSVLYTVDIDRTTAFLTSLRGTFKAISELPVPTIAALSSVALGGGLELALTTNLRVFGSTSIVGLPETRLAIIPGAGGTFRLPAVIGRTRALDLMLTGRRVHGPEAYFLGLCDRLVEVTPEEVKSEGVARKKVLDVAIQLAKDICEGGPIALKAVLNAVGKGEAAENKAYETVVGTKDRDEALLAFQEKRKPVFKGM